MDNHVYKKVEVVGSSRESLEGAILNAVDKASSSVQNLRWFEVVETRGHIENGAVAHFQVTLKIGFRLND